MSWSQHAIWWHVYPLGFVGAPIRPASAGERALTHRLGRLEAWLDYAIELGCNGLLLGPVFASESHGYDTLDFDRIDPRLGDDADFDRLVAACRTRGISVVLDGVFNHVGRGNQLFQRALAGGPDSPEAQYFRIDWATGKAADFEGHEALVALNHDSPVVADRIAEVMVNWLRRGIAGWRLDAAYSVPIQFWATVLPRVREEFPDAWFLGEVIHGEYPDIIKASTMDSVTQYRLWKAIWSSLKDGNFFELEHALQDHNAFLGTYTPQTFVGNHDTTRIATLLPPSRAALAHTVLFTVGGIPSVYYGDEQAFAGTKYERSGGDDEVRPPFPDSPADLSAMGEWAHRLIQDLIGIRRRHPWLTTARTRTVAITNTEYTYDVVGEAGQTLRVELALEPAAVARILEGDSTLLEIAV